jgi:hypothetical protein
MPRGVTQRSDDLSTEVTAQGLGKARVAVARKLGIRLWILLRDQIEYAEFCRPMRAHAGTQPTSTIVPTGDNGADGRRVERSRLWIRRQALCLIQSDIASAQRSERF